MTRQSIQHIMTWLRCVRVALLLQRGGAMLRVSVASIVQCVERKSRFRFTAVNSVLFFFLRRGQPVVINIDSLMRGALCGKLHIHRRSCCSHCSSHRSTASYSSRIADRKVPVVGILPWLWYEKNKKRLFVSTECTNTNVTGRWTDEQTDRHRMTA